MPQPLHLLIVEDNPQDTELVLQALRHAGFEPIWKRVDTEADYLDHLHANLDIILSDYKLPQFDGLRALKLLNESGLKIPFIIVSGTIGEDTAVEAMKKGAADYLLKDRLARLEPAINHAMKQARLQAERKLASEKLLLQETALDEVSQGVLISDENYLITYANDSFTKITGYEENEILGRKCAILQGPDTNLETIQKIRAALNAEENFEGEILNYRKDGQAFWNDLSITALRSEQGQPPRFIGILRDVTERKQAQQALNHALERLQLAVKAGKVGTWDIDMLTGELSWDEQMLALFGKNAENVEPGMERWYSAIHPDDLGKFKAIYEEALQTGKDAFNREFRIYRTNDGSLHFIRGSGIILRDMSGNPLRITGINWDITEERNREEKLSEALSLEKELRREAQAGNRAKNEFLAVMSHEIRTPMNGILGFSELLVGTPNLPADCHDYVKTIASSGEALLRILDDILDFSRMEAGGLQIENSLFSSHEIVQNIHSMLAPYASDKHLEFQMVIDGATPERIWNDAGRLRQVLLNLTGNAIKFTERGTITIGMRPSCKSSKNGQPDVDFFIRDTGAGIREEDLIHIFEPFVQADSSISRRYGGAGLGLAISQNLVKLMGGELTVQTKVGTGSEFHVILPVGTPEGAMASIPKFTEETMDKTFAVSNPLRILLVEDDCVNLKLMLMLLRKLGYEPLIAGDGVEAVEIYRREHPDCILMDLQMPRKDGLQATLEIRGMENGATRPFIAALTANIVVEDRKQCFEAGMDGYMNKPIKHALLVKTLKQASDRKKSPLAPAAVQKS